MLVYLFETLEDFRCVFSRNATWLIFCMVVLGFLGATEMIGISSFCRFWGLGESAYNSFLHFFRSSGWSVDAIVFQWASFVLSQNVAVYAQGRAVLLGDHSFVPKDGRRMPGVVTLRQKSETQTKPSYFRGHCWGAVALLIGSVPACFALPLSLGIHQGLLHIGRDNEPEADRETMGTRIVRMAIDFALGHNMPSILILDAFFPSAAVFRLADSCWSVALKQPLLTLIIKAKKNCTAYFEAEKTEGKRPVGRPKKYGKKVTLTELFDHPHLFSKEQCKIYGKSEEIRIACFDLSWKPAGNLLRFVLASGSHGPIVLMCSNLNQDPIAAVELYCARTRIETMFDMLKNLIGAFCYRFWSKLMPRHPRRPLKNKKLKKPAIESPDNVRQCWEASECFVMIGAISLGLLQLLAIKYENIIWEQFDGFLRTRSRSLPSERTVKYMLERLLVKNFHSFAPCAIMREIRNRYFRKKHFSKIRN